MCVKALLRRAAAYIELEKFDDADADLAQAATMACEKDVAEVRRQQVALKKERAASEREARVGAELAGPAADGGNDAPSGGAEAPPVVRVRELLEKLQGAVGAPAGEAGEAGAAAAIDELRILLRSSAVCRLCFRQAGGLGLLVRLMPRHAAASSAALGEACADRRAQLEFHRSGGTTAVLRALRAAMPEADAPADAPGGAARRHALPSLEALGGLAAQLRLLATCAQVCGRSAG